MSGARTLETNLRRTKAVFLCLALLVVTMFVGGGALASRSPLGRLLRLSGAQGTVGHQLQTPLAVLPSSQNHAYWRFAAETSGQNPLILTFHDIQAKPKSIYALTPQRLESHLAMLEAAGFTTVTSEQLVAYLHGGELPPRSVMLTFDDGTRGIWTYADAILKRHGFRGVAFVITGSVTDQPSYYLTWDELRRMHQSDRWDIESHSKNGHGLVPVDARGSKRPFFVSRQWLPDEHRIESMTEFQRRAREDLDGSIRDLRQNGLPTPRLFAHPRSAGVRDATDPATVRVVSMMLRKRFAASVINADHPRVIDEGVAAQRLLPRLEVYRDTTTRELFAQIAAASPRPVSEVSPFRTPSLWVDASGQPLQRRIPGDRLALWPQEGTWTEALYAPGRTSAWKDYRASVRVTGVADHRTSAGMTVLAGSASEYRVTVSAHFASVRVGRASRYRTVHERQLPFSDQHRISATVTRDNVLLAVDDKLIFQHKVARRSAKGGVSLYVHQPHQARSLPIFHGLRIVPVR